MQEMNSALECIREIFPANAIRTVRVDNPFRVTISSSCLLFRNNNNNNNNNKTTQNQKQTTIWSCKQLNLFQSNPKRRRKAMDNLRQTLALLKEELLTSSSSSSSSSNYAIEQDSSGETRKSPNAVTKEILAVTETPVTPSKLGVLW
jgi:hypothetical protein